MNRTIYIILCCCLLPLATPPATAGEAPFPKFKARVLDRDIGKVCYAVTIADVDGDGKKDIVAVTESSVFWYQAPKWRKRVIIKNQTRADNVCIAAADIDGDGKIDFALGAGWTRIGTIQWLRRGKSLDKPWHVHPIAKEPWLHRMRFADVLGTGKPQLVISPLNKTQGKGVRLTAFTIPSKPITGRWLPTVMNHSLNKMHNHWHLDFDKDGAIDTLTASEEGVSLIRKTKKGFQRTILTKKGAGEVKTGKLKDGKAFIATIEPMHGTDVVVYTHAKTGKVNVRQRHVLDTTLQQGHAVWAADVNGDGADELIVGHRAKGKGPIKGPGLYIFAARNASGTSWKKHVIDNGGIAVEDAFAADLNGDNRIDIVAGGRATRNLKLYINLGTKK